MSGYVIYRIDKNNNEITNKVWSSKTLLVPFEGEIERIQLCDAEAKINEKIKWEKLTNDLIILPCHDEICGYLNNGGIIETIMLHKDELLFINHEIDSSIYFYSRKNTVYYKLFIKN